jgi:DNA-binding protein YbaB
MTSLGTDLDSLLKMATEKIDAARTAADAMAKLEGHGEAEEGRIAVTVSPTGALKSLTIDPRAMRLGSQDLAAAILAAASAASANAADQMRELVTGLGDLPIDVTAVARGSFELPPDMRERLDAAQERLRRGPVP